jgi:hypothetical protein
VRGIGRQPPTQLVGRWRRRRSSDQPSVPARTDVRQKLPSSRPPVSSLSAAVPYATSRRTEVPGSVTLVSRADVVPCKAAADLAKGRAWPDTEEVTGSNPVAPTILALTSRDAGQIAIRGAVPRPVYRMRAVPVLNLPVHGTLGPARSSLVRGHRASSRPASSVPAYLVLAPGAGQNLDQ